VDRRCGWRSRVVAVERRIALHRFGIVGLGTRIWGIELVLVRPGCTELVRVRVVGILGFLRRLGVGERATTGSGAPARAGRTVVGELRSLVSMDRRAAAELMGTDVEVLVRSAGPRSDAAAPDPGPVLHRLAELERCWSRFRSDSEVSRLNALDGVPAVVGADTASLVAHAVLAWQLTGGRFDPLVGDALVGLGYDRSFPWAGRRGDRVAVARHPVDQVVVDQGSGLVRLPAGAQLDPGGIGKGLAADVVTAEFLVEHGSGTGLLVNVGGDLRVGGTPPPGGWEIEVDHLVGPLVRVAVRSGAVATSSRLRRAWRTTAGEPVHHVIDPATRLPAAGPAASVTVLAAEAWWAEALATATLVGWSDHGPSDELRRMAAGCGVLVTATDGRQVVLGDRADEFMVVGPRAEMTDVTERLDTGVPV